MEYFIRSYRIEGIVSSNAIELELPSSIKIYLVVNISQVQLYKTQVEGQKKILPKLVIIEGEEEFEVEKILNKRMVRGKEKFLVQQKGYMAEGDTQESRENLKNIKKLVEKFEREYREKEGSNKVAEKKRQQKNILKRKIHSKGIVRMVKQGI